MVKSKIRFREPIHPCDIQSIVFFFSSEGRTISFHVSKIILDYFLTNQRIDKEFESVLSRPFNALLIRGNGGAPI